MVTKEIVILGDVEMGAGNVTDDFISDRALVTLIISLAKKEGPVDLIFNGDTFDFLKCPLIINGKKMFTRHINVDVSLNKLKLIQQAHQPVFAALTSFVANKKNRLYFIIGNHDLDLFFRPVQSEIKKMLKHQKNIFFPLRYNQHQVYAEHGQQYDFLNQVNLEKIFLKYNGQLILNIPWTSFGIISSMLSLKEKHPLLERIKPYPDILKCYPQIVKEVSIRSLKYFLKSLFYYPLRYYFDPTYTLPKMLMGEFYYRFKRSHWDVDQIVESFKCKKKKVLSHQKLYVLSHIHEKFIEEKEGWVIVHPDTWRDEYNLDLETRMMSPKRKQYVHVLVANGEFLDWNLVEVEIKRSSFSFQEVLQNEVYFLQKAAKEEGYSFSLE